VTKAQRIAQRVAETLEILTDLGIPVSGLTARRRVRMAKAFMAVAGLTPTANWSSVLSDNRLRSRDVIDWMNRHWGEKISSGSYDDIRRKDLRLPVEAGLVLKSAGKEAASTNDGTRAYALAPEAADLLRSYGALDWQAKRVVFMAARQNLSEQLLGTRAQHRIPVKIDGKQLSFGPGEHNRLQKAVIEDFLPLFGFGAAILYVGDTETSFS
jgi:hypothetical protein